MVSTDHLISRQELWDLEYAQLTQERETTDPDPDMWRWSPLELWEFDRMLTVARQLFPGIRELTFCEAGCGIGTKLYLAEHYHNLRATGFEISDDYLAKAVGLGVDARKMDLREDSPEWSEYDIVYTARPFKADDVESAWEKSVCDRMRPGAVIMMAYTSYKPYSWQCYYRAPFRGVWRKPTGNYTSIITRQYPHDPLVPEPGPGRKR